jgi:hypothetical protein
VTDSLEVVHAHVDAFNSRDIEALMATFTADATLTSADGVAIGRDDLDSLFRDAFEAPLRVTMLVRSALAVGDTVATELTELLDFEDTTHEIDLAGFFTVRDGLVSSIRIYRDRTDDDGSEDR